MDVMDCILTRRSIRKYTGEPITREQIDQILRAASYAPSAMKRFPWHFVILTDPEILAQIPKAHPYAGFAPQAGCAILVCADAAINDNVTHLIQDTSAAIENMLLAAHGMGLGACWCGVYGNKERVDALSALCGVKDENILPMSLVVIGNTEEQPAMPERVDESRFHFERW